MTDKKDTIPESARIINTAQYLANRAKSKERERERKLLETTSLGKLIK